MSTQSGSTWQSRNPCHSPLSWWCRWRVCSGCPSRSASTTTQSRSMSLPRFLSRFRSRSNDLVVTRARGVSPPSVAMSLYPQLLGQFLGVLVTIQPAPSVNVFHRATSLGVGNDHFERQSFTHHHLLIKHPDSVTGIHTEAVENTFGICLQLRFNARSDRFCLCHGVTSGPIVPHLGCNRNTK